MALNPHEHRMWAVIGMYGGQEDNAFYRRAPGGLEPSGGKEVPAGDVLVLGDDVIHSVANSRTRVRGRAARVRRRLLRRRPFGVGLRDVHRAATRPRTHAAAVRGSQRALAGGVDVTPSDERDLRAGHGTGVSAWVVVPSPSWPLSLRPQHTVLWFVRTAQLWKPPVDDDVTSFNPETANWPVVGDRRCRSRFRRRSPDPSTSPSCWRQRRARVIAAGEHRLHSGERLHRNGHRRALQRPWPSWPSVPSPQHLIRTRVDEHARVKAARGDRHGLRELDRRRPAASRSSRHCPRRAGPRCSNPSTSPWSRVIAQV